MNIKKAIQTIESYVGYPYPGEEGLRNEALTIAFEAMEKQIPMKPRVKRMPMSMCLSIEEARFYKVCGNCRELVTDENHCPECGQKIDWTEG